VRRRFAPHQLRHAHAGRDGARGCAADRHSTAARTHQPRGLMHALVLRRRACVRARPGGDSSLRRGLGTGGRGFRHGCGCSVRGLALRRALTDV
jgi:hypothetical protein